MLYLMKAFSHCSLKKCNHAITKAEALSQSTWAVNNINTSPAIMDCVYICVCVSQTTNFYQLVKLIFFNLIAGLLM